MKYWFALIYKSQGKRLYIGVFWAFFTMFSGVALLMLSGWFITATTIAGLAISAGLVIMFDMYMPGSGIRFFALSRTIGRYIERIYNHDSILRLISVFRVELFKRLSHKSQSELRATSDSEWLSRLTADLDALDSLLLKYTIPPIAAFLLIFTLTFFSSFIWFELALWFGFFMLVSLALTIRLTIFYTTRYGTSSAKLLNQARANTIEHLRGAYELQSYGLMQQHEDNLVVTLAQFYTAQDSLTNKLAKIQFVLDLVMGIVMLVLVTTVLWAVNVELISGPVAVMFVMMMLGMSEVLQSFPAQFSTWGRTQFSAERLSAITESTDKSENADLATIEKIRFRLFKDARVAKSTSKEVAFTLTTNKKLNVIGRSGSGKSSVANLLLGIYNGDGKFDVTLNTTISITQISLPQWYKQLTYLQQSNAVLAGTLAYNLQIGIESATEEQFWTVLKIVELNDWAKSLPNGLHTWLGESGGKISGGQARRIGIARLLLREPTLVVLDEPFNGIDTNMAARIWQNMSPWLHNKMVVLFTHESPEYLLTEKDVETLSLDIE